MDVNVQDITAIVMARKRVTTRERGSIPGCIPVSSHELGWAERMTEIESKHMWKE